MKLPAARRVWAIVPAAGRGARFAESTEGSAPIQGSAPAQGSSATQVSSSTQGPAPKQYAALLGATVLEWSLHALMAEPRVHAVVVALAADDAHWPGIAARLASPKLRTTIGGANRQDTVANGLDSLAEHAAADDWILVHDAARPCLSAADLGALLDAVGVEHVDGADTDSAGTAGTGAARPAMGAATRGGRAARPATGEPTRDGAVLAAPIVDTVKRDLGDHVATVDRRGLWRALTPQVFAFAQLRHALKEAKLAGLEVTDEAQAVERMGLRPTLVQGSPFNVKVTRLEDLATAAHILKMTEPTMTSNTPMRVGQGFDVHAFGEGDHVILGGVRIAHAKGVVAHSDGDVVIHALCDAVLGALGDGDIGQHFPDSDPRYRGADSRVFLRVVAARVQAAGLKLVNADVTVLAEAPRIAAHRAAMAANLGADLGVAAQLINIKATTTERLGFIGRGEGLAASASVLLGMRD
jgi:2-C-methyl-D-erythritol 4-phosphate cytidylyltransferase/2-C-methyl-D-erythritol 2,4-cyclodiphosphate synthase